MKRTIIAISILILASCKSNEIGNSKDVNPDAIYQEYNVSATEGDNSADFTAQFRFGGKNGTTLVLNDKSNVALDGKELAVDSSGAMGAYYRAYLPMPAAAGEHVWKFTDGNDKSYSNKFTMQPFSMINQFNAPLPASNLELQFKGLSDNDEINIMISDTSSMQRYSDIDTTIKINSGKAIIPAGQMKKLAPGPITFEISKEDNISLGSATREGGVIMYRYQLKTRKATLKK